MTEESLKELFAGNLNYFLALNNKRQVDLAKYLGCGTGSVSDWCNARKLPRMERIPSICNWLAIDLSDLLDDKSKQQEEGYYINEETKKIAKAIYDNPDMRSLFDVSSKMPPDRLKVHIEFMKKLQEVES